MKHAFALVTALGFLLACNNTPEATPPTPSKALGLLEVTLDFSDQAKPTAQANFRPFENHKAGASTLSLTTNGNETSRIKLQAKSLALIDDNESSMYGTATRYVRGTFDIANFGPRAFNNLNFMATSLGTKLGTAFSNLQNGAGSNILDTDTVPSGARTYRAIKPTQGMRLEDGRVVVEHSAADLQIFTPSEASSVQTALAGTYPGLQVLEYGFTARSLPNLTYWRYIPVTPTSANCSATLVSGNTYNFVTNSSACFLGRVTFAFKLPRKPTRAQSPYVFSFVFVVANETNPTTTQSLEEQAGFEQPALRAGLLLDRIAGSSQTYPSNIRTLPGSGITGYPNPSSTGITRTMLCNVKTASATTTPVLPADFLSTAPGVTSVDPQPNMIFVPPFLSGFSAGFCDNMNAPTASNFVLHTNQTGRTSANTLYSGAGNPLTAYAVFKPGEEVEVTLTSGITRSSDAASIQPLVYRFRNTTASTGSNKAFTFLSSIGTPSTPKAVVAADFNNDNKLDFAVSNGANIATYLGNGFGAFSSAGAAVALNTITNDSSNLVSGDFNNDGKMDLAVGSYSVGVGVLLGNGLGGFGAVTYVATGAGFVRSLLTGDFNGDGKLDMAALNVVPTSAQQTVVVVLGNGSGGFVNAPNTPLNLGEYNDDPRALTAGDFNGDGRLDLVATYKNFGTNNCLTVVFVGNGAGGFLAGPAVPVAGEVYINTPAAGDFNNDGKLDLVLIANTPTGSPSIVLLPGNGAAGFDAPRYTVVGAAPTQPIAGDFNGDGKLDVATFMSSNNSFGVLWGDGAGGLSSSSVLGVTGLSTGYSLMGFASGDFNGDDKLDVVFPTYSTSQVGLLTKD